MSTKNKFYYIPCENSEGGHQKVKCKVHLGDIVRIIDDFYVYSSPTDFINKYFHVQPPRFPLKNKKTTKWMVVGMVRYVTNRHIFLMYRPCQEDLAFLLRNYKGEECVCRANAFSKLSLMDILDKFPRWQEKRNKFVIPAVICE
jgi:hypothetical protein